MKKITIFIISLITFILLISLILILKPRDLDIQYLCNSDSDCGSQCSRGCVNNDWANLNPDTSECFRAWDCSCVNNKCYTDGNPRS